MKILHAIYDDVQNPWCGGGGAVRALEISRRLAQRHDITLLSGAYPGAAAQEIRHGVRIRRVGTDRSYLLSRLSFSALASSLLARETFDLWVYNFSAFSPILASAGLRRRCVLEFFHRIAGHAVRKLPVFGLPARIAEEYTLRSFNHLVTISPSVAKQISRARGTQGLHLVYTGVDDACFDIPVSEQDYILYVGRFDVYVKGIDLLLKAFTQFRADYPDVRLVLAGRATPKRLRQLTSLCDALEITEHVEIRGTVSEKTKRELLGGALFTCMPSRYEGWGITAIEAAAVGKAVIGTRIPGLTDAVVHGKTGILVPPDNTDALQKAMRQLTEDSEYRRLLGQSGKLWAKRFSWDRIARDQESVYEEVLSELRKRDVAHG